MTLIVFYQLSYGQNSFMLLDKAEKNVTKGKNEKALKQITEAETCGYCTCGLCVMQVNEKANLLRYEIYKRLGEHKLSRQSLDSIYTSNNTIDSLKVLSYQMEFGKEFLSNKIDSALIKSKITCDEHDCFVQIPLDEGGKEIRLKIGFVESFQIQKIESETDRIEKWREQFNQSNIYKMIKEG
ncbi:MAG: hypothetical protein H6607_02980 [Flavobacteriales bacterium]|nr:hypothetical protein [Flavobacteriales bacterium]